MSKSIYDHSANNHSRKEIDRRKKYIHSLHVAIYRDETKKPYTREKFKIRSEILEFIAQKYREGKSKEEILRRVNFVFGTSKYSIYHSEFPKWVHNVIKRECEKENIR